MSDENKHGLSRSIPTDIKRQIRKDCGFGCVFCGLSLYQYEHIDPPFAEAKEHSPQHICLLCPNHHERVTKGLISKEKVRIAHSHPKALEKGYSHESEFVNFKRPCKVHLGSIHFDNPTEMIMLEDMTLLGIADDEDGKLVFNGLFFDDQGLIILQVESNEWKTPTTNWDVEFVGRRLTLRNTLHSVSLSVTVNSNNELTFDDLSMKAPGFTLISNTSGMLSLVRSNGTGFQNLKNIITRGPIIIDPNEGFRIEGGCMIC